MKFSDMKWHQIEARGYIEGEVKQCVICGAPTPFIEICAEARFCSTECEDAFYSMMETMYSENCGFDEEDF